MAKIWLLSLFFTGCMSPTSQEWLSASIDALVHERAVALAHAPEEPAAPLQVGPGRCTLDSGPLQISALRALFSCSPTPSPDSPLSCSEPWITAHCSAAELLQLNQLLERGLRLVEYQQGLSPANWQAVRLRHIPAASTLTQLLPQNANIRMAAASAPNLLFLQGSPADVQTLASIARALDHSPATIGVECLILPRREVLQFLNEAPTETPTGEPFPAVAQGPLTVLANQAAAKSQAQTIGQLTFSVVDVVDRPSSFNLAGQALIDRIKSVALARPHLSILSGYEGMINIGNEGYTLFADQSRNQTLIRNRKIDASVILKITPTLLANGAIQLQVYVHNGIFLQDREELAASQLYEETQSKLLSCSPGQALRIGGIRYRAAKRESRGTAWWRRIPVVDLFLARESDRSELLDVDILLFPHEERGIGQFKGPLGAEWKGVLPFEVGS